MEGPGEEFVATRRVVRAVQWRRGIKYPGLITTAAGLDGIPGAHMGHQMGIGEGCAYLRRDYGVEQVSEGDWIVRDDQDAVTIVEDEDFNREYEPASPGGAVVGVFLGASGDAQVTYRDGSSLIGRTANIRWREVLRRATPACSFIGASREDVEKLASQGSGR